MCVCVCVNEREGEGRLCVCVCERERGEMLREGEIMKRGWNGRVTGIK